MEAAIFHRRSLTLRMVGGCAILAASLLASGCRTPLGATATLPFGPTHRDTARLARTERAQAWDEWAARHLRTGDIVFRMGVSRVMCNLFDVSKFAAELADSDYSHAGLVIVEDGRPWIYDTCRSEGPRRSSVSEFLMEYDLAFAVKRLKPEYRSAIPEAVRFCHSVRERRVPFDEDFRLENGRLYCTELIEAAYRTGGIALSEPVRIDEFPNYGKHPTIIRLLDMYSTLTPDQKVLSPGNEHLGVWSSEKLELVYAAPDSLSPPSE